MPAPTLPSMNTYPSAEETGGASSKDLPSFTNLLLTSYPSTPEDIIAELSSSQNQNYRIVGDPAAGGSNVVYKIQSDQGTMCLRIPRNPDDTFSARGTSLLKSLKDTDSNLLAPHVICQNKRYTLLEYLDGEVLKSWHNQVLTQERRQLLLDGLASFLFSIWTSSQGGGEKINYREWLQHEVDRGFRRALQIGSTWGDPIYYLYRRMSIDDLVPTDDDGATAIRHGDLNACNVIVNDKGLSGIVDWDTACVCPAPSAVQHPLFIANVPGWLNDVPESMTFEEDRAYLENAIGKLGIGADKIQNLLQTSFERQFMELSLHNRRINDEYINHRLEGKKLDPKKALEELNDFLRKNNGMSGVVSFLELQKRLSEVQETT